MLNDDMAKMTTATTATTGTMMLMLINRLISCITNGSRRPQQQQWNHLNFKISYHCGSIVVGPFPPSIQSVNSWMNTSSTTFLLPCSTKFSTFSTTKQCKQCAHSLNFVRHKMCAILKAQRLNTELSVLISVDNHSRDSEKPPKAKTIRLWSLMTNFGYSLHQ